jgi:hypothetical protein
LYIRIPISAVLYLVPWDRAHLFFRIPISSKGQSQNLC